MLNINKDIENKMKIIRCALTIARW